METVKDQYVKGSTQSLDQDTSYGVYDGCSMRVSSNDQSVFSVARKDLRTPSVMGIAVMGQANRDYKCSLANSSVTECIWEFPELWVERVSSEGLDD